MLGGTLELIALGWMNVGAAQSPDSALASIISAILVIVGRQSIATGIAIALPVAAAGQVLTVFARTITVVFQHAADKAAEDARFRTIDMLRFRSRCTGAARCHSCINRLAVCQRRYGQQYAQRHSGIRHPRIADCRWLYRGGRLRHGAAHDGVKYLMPFFFLGFIAGGYLDLSLLAFGGVGVIIALVYIQLNPQWRKAEPQAQPASSQAIDQL